MSLGQCAEQRWEQQILILVAHKMNRIKGTRHFRFGISRTNRRFDSTRSTSATVVTLYGPDLTARK